MGCGGLSHLGDLMFHKKTLHEMWCVSKWAASHQLPIAEAFWTIWTVSAKEWWDLTQNLMQICCSTCWVMLIAMATPWHLPPPLTSTLKLSLFTHVHSSLLSLAARLHLCPQTILIILAMAGLLSRQNWLKVIQHWLKCYVAHNCTWIFLMWVFLNANIPEQINVNLVLILELLRKRVT